MSGIGAARSPHSTRGRDGYVASYRLPADRTHYLTSDASSERERVALEYAVAMSGARAEVDDALFERVRAEFTEPEIVELTVLAAWENYRSRFNRALGLQAHRFTAGSVCALPEEVPEAAARVRNDTPWRACSSLSSGTTDHEKCFGPCPGGSWSLILLYA